MGFAYSFHNPHTCTATACWDCQFRFVNTYPVATNVSYFTEVKAKPDPRARWFDVFRSSRSVILVLARRAAASPVRRLLHVSLAEVRRLKRRRRVQALRAA